MKKFNSDSSPYQQLYKRELTSGEAQEIRMNLIGFIRTLIEMDRQYNEWVRRSKP